MRRLVARRGLAFACVASFAAQAAWAQRSADVEDPQPEAATQAAAPDEHVEADPVDTGPVDSAPVPSPASVAPTIVIDDASEQRYRECLRILTTVGAVEGQDCLQLLVAEAPSTSGALQAKAALYVIRLPLEREALATVQRAEASPGGQHEEVAPGRLGVGVAAGILGVFTGINGGVLVRANNTGQLRDNDVILGTGAAAVVLGAAGGLGGYLLAEQLQLDEADARLIGSSLTWGTVVGGHVGMIMAASLDPQTAGPHGASNALSLTFVGTTWVAGLGATVAANYLTLTEAQVGLMNSGGLIGATWSPAIAGTVNQAMNNWGGTPDTRKVVVASLAPITIGLVGGGVLAGFVPMTWGEVLICDLGGVLGLVAGGAVMLTVPNDGTATSLYYPAAGSLVAWSATAVGVVAWRSTRADGAAAASRGPSAGTLFRLTAPLMLDRNGTVVPSLGVQGVL